ncbi:DegT/DnrJ/EryC1/StrS family aminotransferase [uncultured Mailhella sp.]|uniref:DegT/DnrJ/EryC1/StrS family aminotransferase n=1 Tax=uncultured Mailhella sp. TaxID=1981031 RepID=UPI00262AF690|nr:DegT/DnrJ/EryC1/StrS family aminotransferase [uncultured Mailhella sp.]
MAYTFYRDPVLVTKTWLPDFSEYSGILEHALKKGWVTNHGDLERSLTERLKAYFDVPGLSLCANGTLALQLALRACDVRGGEVVTTPFTYVATSSAIVWEGATPVFADISPETLMPTVESVEACLTDKTRAILCVHVFGYPAPVEGLQELAARRGIPLIFDAAHAFGVIYKNRPLPSYGDISACSFHATKVFHTVEGGAVLCHSEKLAEKISLLGSFGHVGEVYKSLGINAKMSEFHAAMGLAMLPHVEELCRARQRVAGYYDACLPFGRMTHPRLNPDVEQHNYGYYPVLMENEDQVLRLREKLAEKNIFIRRYFHPSLDTLEYLPHRNECPVSRSIAGRICCLPLSYDQPLSVAQDIAESVNDVLLAGTPFIRVRPAEPPKVSVLTITYNHENYIEDCIKSVAAQECDFPFEHVIGDDASSDRTREIILDYAAAYKHIRPLLQKERTYGLGNVRAVFSGVTAPYVSLCEGDDYFIDPHKLQKQADALDAHPEVAVCAHPVEVFFQNTGKKEVWPNRAKGGFRFMQGRNVFTLPELLKRNFIQTNSVMYRWRFPEKLPAWFNGHIMPQDWYWHILHAETGKILYLEDVMSGYRRHDGGVWATAYSNPEYHRIKWAYPTLRWMQVLNRHFDGRYWSIFKPQMLDIFSCLERNAAKENIRMEYFRDSFPEAAAAYDAEQAKTRARKEAERFVRRVFIRKIEKAADRLRAAR